jgi:N-acetylglucosamine-6-phosphate deacetylase
MTTSANDGFIKFTNCRLAIGDQLVPTDICFSSVTGLIIDHQWTFFEQRSRPAIVHDLDGRIVAPGFIECQINGGYGFDFSVPTEKPSDYRDGVARVNKKLIRTGVTSYLPTVTSQGADVYHKVSSEDLHETNTLKLTVLRHYRISLPQERGTQRMGQSR